MATSSWQYLLRISIAVGVMTGASRMIRLNSLLHHNHIHLKSRKDTGFLKECINVCNGTLSMQVHQIGFNSDYL